jgi:predicted nucleotidyltransferase
MVRSAKEVDQLAQQALETLEREIPISAAFLFGSYVEGGAHEGSDIDLAIFTPEPSRLKIEEKSRLQLILQRRCALDLELHLYPAEALDRARRTNFYGYLLENGKRLR